MKVVFDRHVFHPFHGPQEWPWWLLLSVRIYKCGSWVEPDGSKPRPSWNIWCYTRWGAILIWVQK